MSFTSNILAHARPTGMSFLIKFLPPLGDGVRYNCCWSLVVESFRKMCLALALCVSLLGTPCFSLSLPSLCLRSDNSFSSSHICMHSGDDICVRIWLPLCSRKSGVLTCTSAWYFLQQGDEELISPWVFINLKNLLANQVFILA